MIREDCVRHTYFTEETLDTKTINHNHICHKGKCSPTEIVSCPTDCKSYFSIKTVDRTVGHNPSRFERFVAIFYHKLLKGEIHCEEDIAKRAVDMALAVEDSLQKEGI